MLNTIQFRDGVNLFNEIENAMFLGAEPPKAVTGLTLNI